jgi:hypothetical protein
VTEYTAHVQVPDAAIGASLHDAVLGTHSVTCASLRSGQGTWLSFGVNEDTDDDATMLIGDIRYRASRDAGVNIPEGYEPDSLLAFETAPMIVTHGRTVIHSEGV